MDIIHDWLAIQNDMEFGITQVSGNGILVRMLGHGAELLYDILITLSIMIQELSVTKPAKPVYAS